MELLLWWGLKRELDCILLVKTDYQNERRGGKKKSFQPLMVLLDIGDFPWSDDRNLKLFIEPAEINIIPPQD